MKRFISLLAAIASLAVCRGAIDITPSTGGSGDFNSSQFDTNGSAQIQIKSGATVTNLLLVNPKVPNYGATVDYVWTCTNNTTGEGHWAAATSSATNAVSIIGTNGTEISTSATNLMFYDGALLKWLGTNTSGLVSIGIDDSGLATTYVAQSGTNIFLTTNKVGTAAFAGVEAFQPASDNLTNWSALATNILDTKLVPYQTGSVNLTNWSQLATNGLRAIAAGAKITVTTNTGYYTVAQTTDYDEIIIPAGALRAPATGGAAFGTNTATGISEDVYLFDGTNPETNHYSFKLPDNWDTTADPFVQVHYIQSVTNGDFDVVWRCRLGSAGNEESYTFGTASGLTNSVLNSSNLWKICTLPAVNVGGSPSTGHRLAIDFWRDPDDAGDGVNGDVGLKEIIIQYKRKTTVNTVWTATLPES